MENKAKKMKFVDLKDMLKQSGEVFGDRPAYIFKTETKGEFRTITHKEFRNQINALGTALIQMGLKDKRIAVISENRYEWELAYLAIAAGTGIVVPLDKALPDNELESLILRSQAEAIFYSKKYENIMNQLREKKNTNLKCYISMDLEENTNGIYSQKALVEKGQKLIEEGNKSYLDAKIDSENMGIMLFTSGTTAMSKAVMLSHKNIVNDAVNNRRGRAVDKNGACNAEHLSARAENSALALKFHGGGNNGICKTRYRNYRSRSRIVGDFVEYAERRQHGGNHNQRYRHKRLDIICTDSYFFVNHSEALAESANQPADYKCKTAVFDFVCRRRSHFRHFAVFSAGHIHTFSSVLL